MEIHYIIAYDSESIYDGEGEFGYFDTLEEALSERENLYQDELADYNHELSYWINQGHKKDDFWGEEPRLYEIYKVTTEKVARYCAWVC